jgi:hypothetical protein
MSRQLRALIVFVIVAPMFWWRFFHHAPSATAREPDHATAAATPPSKIVKLRDRAERQQIAEQIAKAAASRRQHVADTQAAEPAVKPELPGSNTMDSPEHVLGNASIALRHVTEFLTDCAKRSPGVAGFKAKLALTGDPDVGTLIDIDGSGMTGDDNMPLPSPFVDCVQDVLMDLELPPMAVGDHYKLDFNFSFADP